MGPTANVCHNGPIKEVNKIFYSIPAGNGEEGRVRRHSSFPAGLCWLPLSGGRTPSVFFTAHHLHAFMQGLANCRVGSHCTEKGSLFGAAAPPALPGTEPMATWPPSWRASGRWPQSGVNNIWGFLPTWGPLGPRAIPSLGLCRLDTGLPGPSGVAFSYRATCEEPQAFGKPACSCAPPPMERRSTSMEQGPQRPTCLNPKSIEGCLKAKQLPGRPGNGFCSCHLAFQAQPDGGKDRASVVLQMAEAARGGGVGRLGLGFLSYWWPSSSSPSLACSWPWAAHLLGPSWKESWA